MKKSSLLLTTVVIAGAGIGGVDAKAYDFSDKIYGKASASIGYAVDSLNPQEGVERDWYHNLQIQGGYNVYFKVTDLIHPFVGMRAGVNIPLTKKDENGEETRVMNGLFYLEALAGAKFNVYKKFAVQPYYFLGYNLYRTTIDGVAVLNPQAKNVHRLSTGVGIDGIYELNNKVDLFAGVEYKYMGLGRIQEDGEETDLTAAHQIGIHFGVQFL